MICPLRAVYSMRKTLCACALLLLLANVAAAQTATVKRNVNLRAEGTTASPVIELLKQGAALTLLDSAKVAGFYHVKAQDGKDGWVWSRNVSVESGAEQPSTPETLAETARCDDSLWDHVYNPQRLMVEQKCIAVTGTIVDATNGKRKDGVRHERDGDTHGWLDVDPEFKNLLNAGNGHEGGNLVFEVVCKFHVTQPDAITSCPSSYHATVQIPPVGSHVRIVGSYVQDDNHAHWMEIHPVTSIDVIPTSE